MYKKSLKNIQNMSKRKSTNHFSKVITEVFPEANVKDWIEKELGLGYNLFLHHFNKGTVKREFVYKAIKKLNRPYEALFPDFSKPDIVKRSENEKLKPLAEQKIKENPFLSKFKEAKDAKENGPEPEQRPRKPDAKPKDKEEPAKGIEDILNGIEFS